MDKTFGVALKAIIKNEKDEYLVLFKSGKDEINPNQVDIPGGRMLFGETFEKTLKREAEEELGIKIEITSFSRAWSLIKEDLHLVGITFNAKYLGGKIKLSFEHDSYSWLKKDEIVNGEYPKWLKEELVSAN